MRFSKSFWNVPSALLAMAALILVAGSAAGQDFFDADAFIDPDDGYQGSGGRVDGSGDDFYTDVYANCVNADNNFEIGCYSDHPDSVNLSKKQGKVDQKKKDNDANVWMVATAIGGEAEDIDEDLDCEKVQIKGKSNSDKFTIDAKCTMKKCKLPGSVSVAQIDAMIQCIDDEVENGDLGKKVGNLKKNTDNEITGKITSKGVWD